MQRYFHAELDVIRANLVRMGDEAIEMLSLSLKGLFERNTAVSRHVCTMDDSVDLLEREVDREAVAYLALRNPVARDLRLVTIAIKAGHDIERVADEANSIAKRSLRIAESGGVADFGTLPAMAEAAMRQMRDALQSFVDGNVDLARQILARDREVDQLYLKVYEEGIEAASADATKAKSHFERILIARSLERVGDHATNLAEEVIYLVTGDEVPKVSDSST